MAEKPVDSTITQPDSHRGAQSPGGAAASSSAALRPAPPLDMDAIGAAVLVCTADAVVVDLNEAAASLLGIDRDATRGSSLRQVRVWAGTWTTESGDRVETAESSIATLAFSGERVEDEVFGLRAAAGSQSLWLRIAAEPLFSPEGALDYVVLTLVDITSLKETRDRLEATADELKELVRTLPDTYVYVDAADVVRRVGGAREAGQGIPRALTVTGVGSHLWDSLPEDAAGRLRNAAALARATGKPVTAEIATVTPTTVLYDEVRHFPHDDGSLLVIVRDVTESRRAGEALRRSEEKYRTLYLRTPVMLHSIDAEGRLLSVSDRWLQRLGYTAAEVLGRPSTEFLTPESRDYARDAVLPAFFASGSCEDVPYQFVAKDGSLVDVLLSATSERDSSGVVIRSLAVLVDVTEQRRAARELAERDRTMQNLLANIPGMAYRCAADDDWTMILLSQGCEELTGYGPDDIVAGEVSYGSLIAAEERMRLRQTLQAAIDEHRPWTITYPITARDGGLKWVWERGRGVYRDDGTVEFLEGFISDVSDLHATEDALREREQMLSAVVASLPGAVYRSELKEPWRTTFLSEGFRTLLGHDPEAFTRSEMVWADVVHPDDEPTLNEDIDRDLAAGSATTESEYRIITSTGDVRWVLDRAMFVHDSAGEPAELIGMLFDVTDLHLALDARAESERRLRTTIGNIPGMVYRSQAAAPWSDEFIAGGDVSVTGYSVEELTAADFRWDGIMHPDDVPLLEAETAVALDSGRGSTEYRIIAKDGSERWLLDRFSMVRNEGGVPVAQEGILLDVTEHHRVERELRESEQRYRALYDGSPVGVFVLDRDLVFRDANAALEEMFHTTSDGLRGVSVTSVVREQELLARITQAQQGVEGLYEGPYSLAGQRDLWLTVKVAPRLDADGAVAGIIGVVVDRTRQKDSEEQVRHLLLHDPVTGLANRSLLEDRVGQALKHAQRKRLSFALAMFRVDRFDAVESSLGLPGIDRVLEELGHRLQGAGRAEDTVAYLGAGAFAALLPGAAGPAEATAAVSGLLAAVGEPVRIDHRELFLTLSLGVALYPTDGAATGELLHNADAAMRQASDTGGDRWQFFHPGLNEEQADRLTLEAELHRALEGDQLFLEYQPLVATRSEEIVGMEALVRWRHPERGVLQPFDFIPVAEDTGVLGQIGAWVLDQACRQGRTWQRRYGKPLRMSVNIGARQLHDHTLVETVRRTLRATGFDAHSLELEITETAAMRDARHTAQILGALRTMGVRVALDDFGTGYSSLSHLVRLPISTVKIDRSFVRDLLTVPEHAAVAASVIALGHRLGLTVVAEGVETIGERGALRDEGCDVIQGFLYSRPLAAEDCETLLEAGVIRR
jgi:diguanylate cyclase (GGDEF)-like protein/PAS domain S-box-containing protein